MIERLNSVPHAFVIGWPIRHSRSPLIHSYWLKRLALAGTYERLAVPPDDLEAFLRDLDGKAFVGGNVTLPHKEHAFALCRERTATAERLGAVNTLWIENGVLWGDNTDVAGFLGCLDEETPGWKATCESAIVLGAGGAARAVVHALASRGCRSIGIVNRTRERAEEVARLIDAEIVVHGWEEVPGILKEADLLVNTTQLGMAGQPPMRIDLAPMRPAAIVSDIVYVPLETGLVQAARARGLRAVGGLGMLLHQAIPGFEKWFGARPQVTPELRALVEADVIGAPAGTK
jgi:shikimate dehydrogenase